MHVRTYMGEVLDHVLPEVAQRPAYLLEAKGELIPRHSDANLMQSRERDDICTMYTRLCSRTNSRLNAGGVNFTPWSLS